MKSIIFDRDYRFGFLRCECDTKYNKSMFVSLIENGCRVCGKEFRRITDTEIIETLRKHYPERTDLLKLFRTEATRAADGMKTPVC